MKKRVKKRPTSNLTEKVARAPRNATGITLVVVPGDLVRVTVAQDNGTTCGQVRGTLIVGVDGVEYRWPNAKKSTGRRLSWDVLTKLMQSGLI
jgi:hypothetical protein